jgi:broad specificity phosphatase PhoE
MLLYLARHGETEENAKGVFQGQSGRGLNARGRAQAARLAERMRHAGLRAIFASDLERAAETARIVGGACGIEPELNRGLREIDVGVWSGRTYAEVAELFPEEWEAWSEGVDIRRGGGETYAELARRVGGAITSIAGDAPVGPILIVSHGGAIKSWIAALLGTPAGGLRALAGVANAAITVVETRERGRYRLRSFNDTAHLDGMDVAERAD